MITKFLTRAIFTLLVATFAAGGVLSSSTQAAVADWQQGANIYPRSTTDISSPAGLASIDQLAASGANYATIVIPYYQSDMTSSDLHPGYDTPTDEALLQAIGRARAQGIDVMLKPHLEVVAGGWRAHINPADRAAWYQAYSDMLVHYARLAEAAGAAQLCIGSELVNVASPVKNPANTAGWQTIIANVRAVYSGSLTYSAQRPGPMGELDTIEFWPQLDYIGTSGYFPLEIEGAPTVEKLQAAWSSWESAQIRPVHLKYNKPVLFTEVGYRSLSGSYNDPWSYERVGEASEADQAMAYEAFMGFWNGKAYMHGVHLWDWEPNPAAGGPGSTSYTPQNKAAYGVLSRWWGGGSVTAAAPAPEVAETPLSAPAPAPVTVAAAEEATTVTAPVAAAASESTTVTAPVTASTETASPIVNNLAGVSVLSGLVTFKASLPGHNLDQYDMYWRVDGDKLNRMTDSQAGQPYKQADVFFGPWNWNPGSTYTVEFVAFDKSGTQISVVAVPISVRQ